MTAHISKEDRALIDAAIAAGKVQIIPEGANTQPQYQYCKETGKLVQIGGMDISVRASSETKLKRMKRARAARPDVVAANARCVEIKPMIEAGMTCREIEAATGHTEKQVRHAAKRLGLTLASGVPNTRERVLAACLANPGASARQIAEIIGARTGTVADYMARFRNEGIIPRADPTIHLQRNGRAKQVAE